MKQRFQILNDPRFHLVYGVTQRFSYGPSPKLVRLNREGFTLVPGLKRKTPVYPGMLLGEHPAPDKGDLFASIHGEISEITERSVFLAATDPSKDAPEVEPVDLLGQGLEGDELALAVKKMGEHPLSWAAVQDADHQRPEPRSRRNVGGTDACVARGEPADGHGAAPPHGPRGQRDPRRAQRLQGGL